MILVLILQQFVLGEGPGGKCGPDYGSCNLGRCCSSTGWCGSTETHCYLPSCNQQYTPQPCLAYDKPISIDGRCGTLNGATCISTRCCSKYGWCGTSDAHCLDGCQVGFGWCGSRANITTTLSPTTTIKSTSSSITTTTTTSSSLPISTNGYCGANYGTRCPDPLCCSDFATCGSTIESCGWTFWACRPGYGRCGGPIPDPPKNSYPPIDSTFQQPNIVSCVKPGLFAMTFGYIKLIR